MAIDDQPAPAVRARAVTLEPSATRSLRALAWLKGFAKLWGFALFCLFIVYVFRAVALPFVFAILVAYLLAPLVDRMARWRLGSSTMPRGLAVVLLYVNILALLGFFVGYFIPKLSADFARLFREAPTLTSKVNTEWVPRLGAWVDRYLGADTPVTASLDHATLSAREPRARQIVIEPQADGRFRVDLSGLALEVARAPGGRYVIAAQAMEEPDRSATEGRWERSIKKLIQEKIHSGEIESNKAIEYGQRFVRAVVTGIARLVLVLMVAAFILIDLERVRGFIRSLVPETYRPDYDHIARGIDRGLAGVIRGQLIICLINGVLTYVGLLIFKIKYPFLLALIATAMSLVPIFGSVLSSIPIVTIALVSAGSFDLTRGLWVLGWIVGVHLIEANFLNPKIMGDAARIHPVLVVFSLIAGEHSYGLVGALFAVPVASIIQTIFTHFRKRQAGRSTTMPVMG